MTIHCRRRLIAQQPAGERTASRLLVLDRRSGTVGHRRFSRDHGLPQGRRPHRAERDEGHACAAYGDQGDRRGGRYPSYGEGRGEKMGVPRLRLEARSAESARGRDSNSSSSRQQPDGPSSSRTAPVPKTLWGLRPHAPSPLYQTGEGRRQERG